MPKPAIEVEVAGHTVRVPNPHKVSFGGPGEPDFCERVPEKHPSRLETVLTRVAASRLRKETS